MLVRCLVEFFFDGHPEGVRANGFRVGSLFGCDSFMEVVGITVLQPLILGHVQSIPGILALLIPGYSHCRTRIHRLL